MVHESFLSPFGELTIFAEHGALVALEWGRAPRPGSDPVLFAAGDQLRAYFEGRRKRFDLPLSPAGTPFQKAVWRELARIPYGTVETYGSLAARLGSAPRAVGAACARNPIPIVVPCHRVVGADGSLGGYSGGEGLATKRALLRLEGVNLD